jgi:hypothetical protein
MIKINITEEEGKGYRYFRADCSTLPGTPPCGFGYTKEEAVTHLFYCLLAESFHGQIWTRILREEMENDGGIDFCYSKRWQWPKGLSRGD